MKTLSPRLKAAAREHLEGRYVTIILAYVIANMLTNLPSLFFSETFNTSTLPGYALNTFANLVLGFFSAIFLVGQNHICLQCIRGAETVPLSEMWYGFRGRADEIITTYFLYLIRYLATGLPFAAMAVCYIRSGYSLWFGILSLITLAFMMIMWLKISLDYGILLFLFIDRTDLSPSDTLAECKKMMLGNRKQLLYLHFSFAGMFLLVFLSFGIAMFWLYPYMRMTYGEFYCHLAGEKIIPEDSISDNPLETD
ncbi:MAG: DUF975 family protein [Lachnospiraceae bacterium]|nr:DUF975 family protein [Lachnospiraceae bacterium]